MTIVAITPIHINHNISNAVQNTTVDVGELFLVDDIGRIILGESATYGNPHIDRSFFPYSHIEVLTENSSKNKEIFTRNVRNQNNKSFLFAYIANGVGATNVATMSSEGAVPTPLAFMCNSVSANLTYHAISQTDGVCLKSGTLRICASGTSNSIVDHGTANSSLTFSVSTISGGYQLQATNTYNQTITLYLKKTSITY